MLFASFRLRPTFLTPFRVLIFELPLGSFAMFNLLTPDDPIPQPPPPPPLFPPPSLPFPCFPSIPVSCFPSYQFPNLFSVPFIDETGPLSPSPPLPAPSPLPCSARPACFLPPSRLLDFTHYLCVCDFAQLVKKMGGSSVTRATREASNETTP